MLNPHCRSNTVIPSAGSANLSSTASPACPSPSNTTTVATDNCHNMGTRYESQYSNANFTVECGLDYAGNDMMGVYVYTFEDCIESCASYNARIISQSQLKCARVSYDKTFEHSLKVGNCFWKASGLTQIGSSKSVTSSATWIDG